MMGEFSRRDVLSTGVVAGASMTASAADAGEQILEPAPGVSGSNPVRGDVARKAQNLGLINPPATASGTQPNLCSLVRGRSSHAIEPRPEASG
jgi:hypothetical protein